MKFRKISVPCIVLALLSQGCSPSSATFHGAILEWRNPTRRQFPVPAFRTPKAHRTPILTFRPGYLISPNPPVPAPSDKYCRDVGAVSTSSPVIGLSQPSNTEVIPSTNQMTLNGRAPYDRCAIEYANNARAEYVRAGSVYSSTPGVLASVLIPVGGAALALGIEGIASGVVTGLGVGGASLLGMGTFYQHKDREIVYNTGANAIDCLSGTMQPFTDVSDDTLFLLAQYLAKLNEAKADLELDMTAYQNLHIYDDCTKDAKARKDAATLLNAAQTADKAAQASLQAGIDFNTSTLAAPTTIVYSVYSINDGIIKGLINTEPDVQTLAGNLKGVIPDSADNLAGIKQAQSATSQSGAAMNAVQSSQPRTAKTAAGPKAAAAEAKVEVAAAKAEVRASFEMLNATELKSLKTNAESVPEPKRSALKTESDQHQSDVAAASANADKTESEAQSAELNEHSTFAGSQEYAGPVRFGVRG